MNSISSTAEVWLIHENQAFLFRQYEQQWRQELAMPFAEFLGSAAALSSFTLPDTTVLLNLKIKQNLEDARMGHCWVGLAHDPLRLIEVQDHSQHAQQLQDIRAMGKVATVIFADTPQHFERGIEMMLLHPREHQHLKRWISAQKNGAQKLSCDLQLCSSLWLKAELGYQHVRLAAIACTVFSIFAMHWYTGRQLEHQVHQIEKSIQQTQAKAAAKPATVSFEQWAEQINKFGKNNRANLQSLSIHWNYNGDVYSYAELDRDRKRVPKGCALESPIRVQCSTKASTR